MCYIGHTYSSSAVNKPRPPLSKPKTHCSHAHNRDCTVDHFSGIVSLDSFAIVDAALSATPVL